MKNLMSTLFFTVCSFYIVSAQQTYHFLVESDTATLTYDVGLDFNNQTCIHSVHVSYNLDDEDYILDERTDTVDYRLFGAAFTNTIDSLETGIYTIQYQVTDTLSDVLYDSVHVVSIVGYPEPEEPVDTTDTLSTSINMTSLDKIDVFPNPTTGLLNLRLPEISEDWSIFVTDITGKEIFRESYANGGSSDKQIDLSDHPPGIYLVNLIPADGEMVTRKIVKQ